MLSIPTPIDSHASFSITIFILVPLPFIKIDSTSALNSAIQTIIATSTKLPIPTLEQLRLPPSHLSYNSRFRPLTESYAAPAEPSSETSTPRATTKSFFPTILSAPTIAAFHIFSHILHSLSASSSSSSAPLQPRKPCEPVAPSTITTPCHIPDPSHTPSTAHSAPSTPPCHSVRHLRQKIHRSGGHGSLPTIASKCMIGPCRPENLDS